MEKETINTQVSTSSNTELTKEEKKRTTAKKVIEIALKVAVVSFGIIIVASMWTLLFDNFDSESDYIFGRILSGLLLTIFTTSLIVAMFAWLTLLFNINKKR